MYFSAKCGITTTLVLVEMVPGTFFSCIPANTCYYYDDHYYYYCYDDDHHYYYPSTSAMYVTGAVWLFST